MKSRRVLRATTLALLPALVASACGAVGAPAGQATVVRDQAVVAFRGEIDVASSQRLVAELRPSDTLRIRSDGGLRSAAVVVGQAVITQRATVEVNGRCFSACALYVALLAPRVSVGEGSTLLFHSTPAIWRRAIGERPELFSESERRRILAEADWLNAALVARGIDPAILDCIDRATGAELSAIQESPGPLSDRPLIPMRFSFAWLSPQVLAHFGARNIQADWVVAPEARESYETFQNQRIAWVDDPADCQ